MFAEVPSYILVLLVMDIIGRKPLFSGSLLFTGIACIISGVLETVNFKSDTISIFLLQIFVILYLREAPSALCWP